ncbi:hypothetical protein FisN_7Lh332 [Fistulifera solaris]|uniref:Uncharacterized protein n=1 Tax=Fistulifera solaris TaxID=1519565 RepID=A0A1Z5JRE6_FISSO|nr:hypothetical protein FisN_7Lh332 [Fistulifera solaris]|eukprot:GAX16600.1 hypothetical protein FisN_7Lh332 [Fistulifera solaris]
MPSWIESLRMQHAIDVEQYERAHKNMWNQYLHCALIPIEYGSYILLISFLLQSALLRRFSSISWHHLWYAVHGTIALVTWILGPFTWVTGAAALYSIAVGVASLAFADDKMKNRRRAWVLLLWILSWTIQIGVGHMWLEGNRPNLITDSVSWLSMTQSVLMAWKTCT